MYGCASSGAVRSPARERGMRRCGRRRQPPNRGAWGGRFLRAVGWCVEGSFSPLSRSGSYETVAWPCGGGGGGGLAVVGELGTDGTGRSSLCSRPFCTWVPRSSRDSRLQTVEAGLLGLPLARCWASLPDGRDTAFWPKLSSTNLDPFGNFEGRKKATLTPLKVC